MMFRETTDSMNTTMDPQSHQRGKGAGGKRKVASQSGKVRDWGGMPPGNGRVGNAQREGELRFALWAQRWAWSSEP